MAKKVFGKISTMGILALLLIIALVLLWRSRSSAKSSMMREYFDDSVKTYKSFTLDPPGTDRYYAGAQLAVKAASSFTACADECDSNPLCKSFTWVPKDPWKAVPDGPACYLKDRIPPMKDQRVEPSPWSYESFGIFQSGVKTSGLSLGGPMGGNRWNLQNGRVAGSVRVPDNTTLEVSFDITILTTSTTETEILCVADPNGRNVALYFGMKGSKLVIIADLIPAVHMFSLITDDLPIGTPLRCVYTRTGSTLNGLHTCVINGKTKTGTSNNARVGGNLSIYMAGKVYAPADVIIQNLSYLMNGQSVAISQGEGPPGPSLGGPSLGGPSLGGPSLGGPSLGGPSLGGPSLGGPSLGGPSFGNLPPPYKSITFDPPGMNRWQPNSWIGSGNPNGSDYKDIATSDFYGCADACDSDPNCKSFAFTPKTSRCYLKNVVMPLVNQTQSDYETFGIIQAGVKTSGPSLGGPSFLGGISLGGPSYASPQGYSMISIAGPSLTAPKIRDPYGSIVFDPPGFDRNRGYDGTPDMADTHTFTSTIRLCADKCDRDPTCKSFVWAKNDPNFDSKPGGCYLKKDVPPLTKAPVEWGLQSGVKGQCPGGLKRTTPINVNTRFDCPRMDRSISKNNLDYKVIPNITSAASCAKECDKDNKCKAMTWHSYNDGTHPANSCILKSGVPMQSYYPDHDGLQSGVKFIPSTAGSSMPSAGRGSSMPSVRKGSSMPSAARGSSMGKQKGPSLAKQKGPSLGNVSSMCANLKKTSDSLTNQFNSNKCSKLTNSNKSICADISKKIAANTVDLKNKKC